MFLNERIEEVRKNPALYFTERQILLEQSLRTLPTEDLSCLLFSTANFNFESYFTKIETELSQRIEWSENKVIQYHYQTAKGLYERSCMNSADALAAFTKATDLAILMPNDELLARATIYISTIYDMLEERNLALEHASKAIRITLNLQNNLLIGDAYMNYGLFLSHEDNHKGALQAYHQAHAHYHLIENRKDYLNYCILELNMSELYYISDKYDLGEEYLGRSLKIAEANGFIPYLQGSIKLIADYFSTHNEFEKANSVLSLYLDAHLKATTAKFRQVEMHEKATKQIEGMYRLRDLNLHLNDEVTVLKSALKDLRSEQTTQDGLLDKIGNAILNKEFVPFLQGKWSIAQNRFTGAEMLARWRQSDGSYISPNDFIGLVENSNWIIAISEMLIRDALETVSPIISSINPQFVLSINISPYQLVHQDVVRLLENCCIESGIQPSNIEVEIIERTFIENNPLAIDQLFQLKAHGFQVSLDDFGSGYSSLACIVDLPLTTVKIDRSLVHSIDQNDRSKRLFGSIVTMLHELEIESVAEGVETESEMNVVVEAGCHYVQGFLKHRPCDLKTFAAWMK